MYVEYVYDPETQELLKKVATLLVDYREGFIAEQIARGVTNPDVLTRRLDADLGHRALLDYVVKISSTALPTSVKVLKGDAPPITPLQAGGDTDNPN